MINYDKINSILIFCYSLYYNICTFIYVLIFNKRKKQFQI